MRSHILSTARITRVAIGAALAPRGQGPRCLGATCVMHVSQNVSKHQTMSSTAKLTLAFAWRTTVLRAGRVGWMMTSSSSNFSPIYLADTAWSWLDQLARNRSLWSGAHMLWTGAHALWRVVGLPWARFNLAVRYYCSGLHCFSGPFDLFLNFPNEFKSSTSKKCQT
jgi:hypothetical protein